MTERIDHVAEALACEATGLSIWHRKEMAPHMEVVMQLDLARLHAQLALVEQQRIANLIALASLPGTNGFEDVIYDARTVALMEGLLNSETVPAVPGYGPAGLDERVFIRPEIREGLGL